MATAVSVTRGPERAEQEFCDEVVMGDIAELASVAVMGWLTVVAVGLVARARMG